MTESQIEKAKALMEKHLADGFSCAEVTIRTLADFFAIPLSEETLRMTSTFRGGASIDGKCGIIESTLAFISYLSAIEGKECCYLSQEELPALSQKLHARMKQELGSDQCGDLWAQVQALHGEDENVRCVIREGVMMMIDVLCSNIQEEKAC